MPDYYSTIRAARYLGVAPWELEAQPSYWQARAEVCEGAEAESGSVQWEQVAG